MANLAVTDSGKRAATFDELPVKCTRVGPGDRVQLRISRGPGEGTDCQHQARKNNPSQNAPSAHVDSLNPK